MILSYHTQDRPRTENPKINKDFSSPTPLGLVFVEKCCRLGCLLSKKSLPSGNILCQNRTPADLSPMNPPSAEAVAICIDDKKINMHEPVEKNGCSGTRFLTLV